MSNKTTSHAKYPAAQVAQMVRARIESIHLWRKSELLKDYVKWAAKQNERVFNWFGLTTLKKYPLDVKLPNRIYTFDELPVELKEFVRASGDFISPFDEYQFYGYETLTRAQKLLNLAENLIKNEQILGDKVIYLSVEDFNIINQ